MLKTRAFRATHVASRLAAVAFTALVGFALWGCAPGEHELTDPGNQAPGLSVAPGQQPDLDSALAVHRRHTMRLMAIPGVVGTAVGLTADGRPAIKIFTKETGVAGLPDSLEGIPVEVQVTGAFFAMPAQGGATASSCSPSSYDCTPKDGWPTPVPIGVSTFSSAFCDAGTIGARVKVGTAVYALSNNHIYAGQNTVPIGTNVLQPGLFDTECSPSGSTSIGALSGFAPIAFCSDNGCTDNTIDAAIAISDATNLDNTTPPDGYGAPDSVVRAAALGLLVQKYGRTSTLTIGQVTGIDATVVIGYSSGLARFVHQIVVSGCSDATKCSKPGDSGSLWVTYDASKSPVGLNFAGNGDGSIAFANQIGDVLTYFGATVDGTPSPTASGGLSATCVMADAWITSVTASGSTITVRDRCGNTGTMTLSGATASGGLTATCFMCTAWIKSVTASGSTITVRDQSGHTGTITLSGATASGGLTATCVLCSHTQITSVTASGNRWISLRDFSGNRGHIRLSY